MTARESAPQCGKGDADLQSAQCCAHAEMRTVAEGDVVKIGARSIACCICSTA
jgi:hypothetical protein